MALDRRLLDILCCPVSKVPVRVATSEQVDALNAAIAVGGIQDVGGNPLTRPIEDALITTDSRTLYRIEDGIPVMLADQGIKSAQLDRFPS